MFSSLSRKDFSPGRLGKVLPVFFLLWSAAIVLAAVSVTTGRSHLRSVERIEAENLLEAYLAAHRVAGSHFGTLSLRRDHLLPGLVFVRIQQGTSQLLLMGPQGGSGGFEQIAGLSPETEGVWMEVEIGGEPFRLTLISRNYPNNLRIQVAKDGSRGYRVYRRMIWVAVATVGTSLPLLLYLSILLVRLTYLPLVKTRQEVAKLANSLGDELLPEQGNGPELDQLCQEINRLLGKNRQLVVAMQQSLDNVAHDLRTPMTRLRSVAEYGLQEESDVERLREALADCLEESDRVLAMLRIMMSVAEAEAGTMRLELAPRDLVELLGQVVELYEYVAEENGVELVLEVPEEPVEVRVDATRISQVVANLVDNGIKYTEPGGRVVVRLFRSDTGARIEVEDNGMGISESEQQRIWERLYRGDRSRSKKGLGLGLNYVRAVVKAHGGEVAVRSRLHEGSLFSVSLPHSPQSPLLDRKSHISGESGQKA